MWSRMSLVRIDVSEYSIASIISVKRMSISSQRDSVLIYW
jgi:hypothetical protein